MGRYSRNRKDISGAVVEQWGEGQAARSRGNRSWFPLASLSLEAGLWFYSKGILEGRAGKPGQSEIHLRGSLLWSGRQSPPEGQEAKGRDGGGPAFSQVRSLRRGGHSPGLRRAGMARAEGGSCWGPRGTRGAVLGVSFQGCSDSNPLKAGMRVGPFCR